MAGGLLAASVSVLLALMLGGSSNERALGRLRLDTEQQRGRDLFVQECASCHTLAAVNSVQRVGFAANLDARIGTGINTDTGRKALLLNAISEGRDRGFGQMPARLLVGKDARDVASFIVAVAGRLPAASSSTRAVVAGTGPIELHHVALNPLDTASKSSGEAQVFSEGDEYVFRLKAKHLPPSDGFHYDVWLVSSGSRLVGQLYPVGSSGRLEDGDPSPLSAGPGTHYEMLLTKETSEYPTQPGPTILSGAFTLALKLAASADGQLSYNTNRLSTKAGMVLIVMTNMSPVTHNVTIAEGRNVLGETPFFQGGKRTLTLNLKPGAYTFYCSVPGHRQAGMEGQLIVK